MLYKINIVYLQAKLYKNDKHYKIQTIMKTKILTLSYTGSKFFFLLTILLLMAGTMSVQATDYDLWVGGKRVTSSNANNITTRPLTERQAR